MRNINRKTGFYVFIFFLGAIAGTLIGDVIGSNVTSLSFLKSVYSIGLTHPLNLNLKVVDITFGINFNLNIMSIIGSILAIILIKKY